MSVFEVRGITLTETNAQSFKGHFTGQDWREKLVEGFNHMLKDSKQKKLTTKERHAFYKWLADVTK